MRGFRGSRSAQNEITSRFGKNDPHSRTKHESADPQHSAPGQASAVKAASHLRLLPAWIQTPETRALLAEQEKNKPVRKHEKPKLELVRQPVDDAVQSKNLQASAKARGKARVEQQKPVAKAPVQAKPASRLKSAGKPVPAAKARHSAAPKAAVGKKHTKASKRKVA